MLFGGDLPNFFQNFLALVYSGYDGVCKSSVFHSKVPPMKAKAAPHDLSGGCGTALKKDTAAGFGKLNRGFSYQRRSSWSMMNFLQGSQ